MENSSYCVDGDYREFEGFLSVRYHFRGKEYSLNHIGESGVWKLRFCYIRGQRYHFASGSIFLCMILEGCLTSQVDICLQSEMCS